MKRRVSCTLNGVLAVSFQWDDGDLAPPPFRGPSGPSGGSPVGGRVIPFPAEPVWAYGRWIEPELEEAA